MTRTKKVQTKVTEPEILVSPSPTEHLKKTEVVNQIQLSPKEIQAILSAREQLAAPKVTKDNGADSSGKYGLNELADALMQALNAVKPTEKKSIMTRKKINPWTPKDGSPKIMEFRRAMFHHGIPIEPKFTHNEACLLLDKIRPGTYCDKLVKVKKRKDGGLDIDYLIRTNSQRLKVLPYTGGKGFTGLLERIIAERADPKKYAQAGALDDDDE